MKMLQELCAAFLFPSQLRENRYCTSSWTLKAGCWLPFPLQHASSYIFIYFFYLFINWLLCIFFLNFLWGSCKSNCVYPAEFVISADFHRTSGLWINFECHIRQGHRPWSCNFGGARDSWTAVPSDSRVLSWDMLGWLDWLPTWGIWAQKSRRPGLTRFGKKLLRLKLDKTFKICLLSGKLIETTSKGWGFRWIQ